MVKIYDLENAPLNARNGRYMGQSGLKEGIDFEGKSWLVKYPKTTYGMRNVDISYTTSPLSEYVGSHIYDILGYDVHETILGVRNKKLVVACKDFCADGKELREIRALKNIYNEELAKALETSLSGTSSDYVVDLEDLYVHLRYNPVLSKMDGLLERFWDCVVIDILINNNDRNSGNWGLLLDNEGYTIAPVYDNGAAFSNKISDEKIRDLLKYSEKLEQSALNTQTTYGWNGKMLFARSMLKLKDSGLDSALKRVVPLIINKKDEIERFIEEIPEKAFGLEICSMERKQFMEKSMELRLEKLLVPALWRVQLRENLRDNGLDPAEESLVEKMVSVSMDRKEIITVERAIEEYHKGLAWVTGLVTDLMAAEDKIQKKEPVQDMGWELER